MSIPVQAQTVSLFVPKFGAIVAVNLTDEALYREQYGACGSKEEYDAKQATAAAKAKPFPAALKKADKGDKGEKAPEGEKSPDGGTTEATE